jgi:hypothetical protein
MSSSLNLLLSSVLMLLLLPLTAIADTLPAPKGKVLLTITGNIKHSNGDGIASFDREMLEALGMVKLDTETYWTDGLQQFEGVPAKAIFELVGVTEGQLRVHGIDDYSASVPVEDMYEHRTLIALKNHGEYMKIRNKGPLWLVYPLDERQQLKKKQINSRSVWQLSMIEVL